MQLHKAQDELRSVLETIDEEQKKWLDEKTLLNVRTKSYLYSFVEEISTG